MEILLITREDLETQLFQLFGFTEEGIDAHNQLKIMGLIKSLSISREVEFVDVDFEYQYFLEEHQDADTLGEYFAKEKFKLIKIKNENI
jgi:hypothetical protein